MRLLHIDSSITGDNSVSRQVTATIVQALTDRHPDAVVTHRDLVASPIPHLTFAPDANNDAVLAEFLASDTIVIGAPMYNFGVPSQLKAWIDRIAVAGKTFSYGPDGPKGLAGGKKVLLALSRGGYYGAGTPAAGLEHVETYLRGLFGFLGITDITAIMAEGVNIGPEQRQSALDGAQKTAKELV